MGTVLGEGGTAGSTCKRSVFCQWENRLLGMFRPRGASETKTTLASSRTSNRNNVICGLRAGSRLSYIFAFRSPRPLLGFDTQ